MNLEKIKKTLLYQANLTILNLKNQFTSTEDIFTTIYKKNKWKSPESRSGPGSNLDQTRTIRRELPKLFRELGISTLLDIPCGDFNWLKEVDLGFLSYTGADVVEELIIQNDKNYANDNRKFIKLNILDEKLPTVDLILCRDLLQHFSTKDKFRALENIRQSNSKYLLTSSQLATKKNLACATGGFTPLNLLLPPFSFPKPLKIIAEENPTENDFDKSLLLWEINQI